MEADGVAAIDALARGRFHVLGELGRDDTDNAVWLARGVSDRSLVALRLGSGDARPGEARLEVSRELDASLPAGWTACPVCRKTIQWRRYCPGCGADLHGLEATAIGGLSASQLVERLVTAAGARFEVLGSMQRAEASTPVVFARTRTTGELVALSLPGDGAGEQRGNESLGVTRFGTMGPAEAGEELNVCPVCGGEYGGGLRFCPQDASILQPKQRGDEHTGTMIGGRYHVLEKLGEGGMGQVYLAEHVMMRRRCALKMIKPGLTRCVDSVNRFRREANNASRISHPNVAVIYDFGEADGGVLYLAMEYVDGESLAALAARESPLPVARAVEIARQVADALTAAHHIGMVHRDLKPDNILLARDMGGGDQVKVVDFGIAKGLSGEGQDITRAGFVVGTPRYMSPEQLMGEPVDGRSDLYSLGCILYEVLTGKEPFGCGEGAASLTRRLVEPTPHPRSHRSSISRELNDLVVRALARLPVDRYQTAAELRDALAGVSLAPAPGARPPAPGPDDAAAAVVVARRRRTYPVYLAGGVVLVLLAALAVNLWPGDRGRGAPDPVLQDAAEFESEQPRLPDEDPPDPADVARLAAEPLAPERRVEDPRTVAMARPQVAATPALPLGSAADFGASTAAELEEFRRALESRRFGVLDRLMRAEQVDRLRSALAEPGALRAEAKIIASHPDRETVAFFVEIVDAATGHARFFGGYRALFVPVPGGWKLADVSPDQ
jgi:tRNA A-37 threonylcarbamoyl transferase component Bud32